MNVRGGRAPRRAALLGAALIIAACSGRSIQVAGLGPATTQAGPAPVTVTIPPATVPGQTIPPGQTAPSTTSTVPETTTTTPLDNLPSCDPDALDAADGPIEVTFWNALSGGENQKSIERVTAAYNISQDRVRINLQTQGGYEETMDKYLQSGDADRPDMVMAPEYAFRMFRDSESMVPVDACIAAEEFDTSPFLPTVIDAYATEGVRWAMPFAVSNPVLYFNRKAFIAAGLDPDNPPRSLEEFRAACQQLVESGAVSYGFALDSGFDSGGGWFMEQWFAKGEQFYSDNENGRSAPSKAVNVASPFGVELFTYLQQLVDDGLAIYVGENASGQESLLRLVAPDKPAAMTLATSAALGQVIAVLNGGAFPEFTVADLGVGPMPGPGANPAVLVGGNALWMHDVDDPAVEAAAWDYIKYLTSAQTQSDWAAATGYVPLRIDALELDPIKSIYENDPRYKIAYQQLVDTPAVKTSVGPIIGPLRQIRVALAGALSQVLGEQHADPATALVGAANEANVLIANYGSD